MSALRLLVVTTRYWPQTDDATGRLQTLIEGLRRSGIGLTVLAARFSANWPEEIFHRETRVVRPLLGPRSEWARGRYFRALAKWMREHLGDFDAVYVDSARDEAAVAVDVYRGSGIPVVIRAAGTGEESDVARWATVRHGNRLRARCLLADRIIAGNRIAEQQLIAAGAAPTTVRRIDDGFPVHHRITPEATSEIRSALASLNSDLCVPHDGRVAVSLSRFETATGIMTFAHAICRLGGLPATSRYWLLGDGPLRDRLYDDFKHAAVKHCAFMPGSFDNAATVLCGADLFVLPGEHGGLEHYLPTAVALGLPIVAPDAPAVRHLLSDAGGSVRFFKSGCVESLSETVQAAMAEVPEMRSAAERYRSTCLAGQTMEKNVMAHAKLLYSLTTGHAAAGVAS